MTDELVKRLRAVDHMSLEDCFCQSSLYDQAADRIEQLTAERDVSNELGRALEEDAGHLREENARLRVALTRAADSLGWADAHLEDAGVVSANVRYGEKSARAALKGETP